MAKLFTGPMAVPPRGSTGVKDPSVSRALRSLEDSVGVVLERLSRAEVAEAAAPVTGTSPIVVVDQDVSLAASGVTPGSYTNANITVDAHGLVTAASSGGGGISDVLTVAHATLADLVTAVDVNCSVEGTVDYFAPIGAPGLTSQWQTGGSGTANAHDRISGAGRLRSGIHLVSNGLTFVLVTPTRSTPMLSRTVTADDNSSAQTLTTNTNWDAIGVSGNTLNSAGNGPGYRVVLPATVATRTLKLYTEQWNAQVTVRAALVGRSSVTPVSLAYTPPGVPFANDAGTKDCWTITYAAATQADLVVTVLITGIPSPSQTTAYVGLAAATLA